MVQEGQVFRPRSRSQKAMGLVCKAGFASKVGALAFVPSFPEEGDRECRSFRFPVKELVQSQQTGKVLRAVVFG